MWKHNQSTNGGKNDSFILNLNTKNVGFAKKFYGFGLGKSTGTGITHRYRCGKMTPVEKWHLMLPKGG